MAKVNLTDKYSAQVNNIVNKSTPKTVNPYNQQPLTQVTDTVKPLSEIKPDFKPLGEQIRNTPTQASYLGETSLQALKGVGRTIASIPSAITLGTSIKPEERKDTVTIDGTKISTETPTYDPYNQSEQYRNIKSSLETQYGSYANMPKNTKAIYENVVNSVLTVDNFGKTFEEQITNIQNEYADKPIPSFMQEKLDVLQDQQLEYTAKVDNARQKLVQLAQTNVKEITAIQQEYADKDILPITEYAGKVASTIIQMSPYIAASIGGGFAGGALASNVLGSSALYATVYTNSLGTALSEGATTEQANTYAHVSALIEAGTELLFGGIPGATKGVLSKGVNGLLEKALVKESMSGSLQKLITKSIDVFGEGSEEFLAEYLGSMALSIYTEDERSPEKLKQDAIDSFVLGMVTSGTMQLVRIAGIKVLDSIVTDKQVNVENIPIEQANAVMNKIATRANIATVDGQAYRIEDLGVNEKGYYDASTRQIVLNKKEVDQYGLIDTALPHEMTHALEGTKAYQEMANFIMQSKQEEFDVSVEELRQLYQAKFDQVHEQQVALGNTNHTREIATNDTMAREMIAEYIRNNFASRPMKDAQGNIMRDSNGQIILYRDYNALLDLAKKPTIVSALKKTLQNFVLKSKLADAEGTSKEAFLQAQAYFESLDTFLSNALKNAPTQKQEGLPQVAFQLTNEQETFFKNSKARDDKGNLITVYHGSDRIFNAFKRGKKGYLGGLIYLTDNFNQAKRYTNTENVKELYVNIENPLTVTTNNPTKEILNVIYGSDTVYNKRSSKQEDVTYLITKLDLNNLESMGYDGIEWKFGGETEYAVFNSNQIKEVSNLAPTLSPDIRYSLDLNKSILSPNNDNGVRVINEFGEYNNTLEDAQKLLAFSDNKGYGYNSVQYGDEIYTKDTQIDNKQYSLQKDQFFQDSKVRDEENNLLNVYHGTPNQFTVFDIKKLGNNRYNRGIFGAGFYFTNVKDIAQTYGENLMELNLNITNPFYINKDTTVEDIENILGKEYPNKEHNRKLGYGEIGVIISAISELKANDLFTENLKKLGYDGVIYDGSDKYNNYPEYVAFYPNQIKESTNEYPTKHRSIRYSLSTDSIGNLTTSKQESDFTVRENGQLKVFYYNENGISENALNYGYFLNESSQGLDNVKQVYVNANVVDANGSELQSMDLSKYDIEPDMTNTEIIKSVGDKFGIEEVTNLLNEITQSTGINALQFDNALMVFNQDQYSNVPERVFRDDVAKIEYKKVGNKYQINEYNEYNDLIHSELMTQDEVIENVGQFAEKVLTNATNQFNVSDAKPDNSKVTTQQVEFLSDSAIKNEDGSPKHVYHGSPNVFEIFSYQNMGRTGLVDGVGFYFTDNKEFASGFSGETGKVYDVFLNIKNPTDETSLTINKEQLKEIMLDIDSKFDGDFLNNYDDVSRLGKEKVVNNAVNEILNNNTNDKDIINSLMDTVIYNSDSFEPILRSVMDKTGIDGFVINKDYGTLYIPFVPEQIVSTTNPIPQAEPTTEKITYNDSINQVTITDTPTQAEYKALESYFNSASLRDGVNIYVNVSSLNGATDGKIYTIANTGSQIVKDIKEFYKNDTFTQRQYSLEQEREATRSFQETAMRGNIRQEDAETLLKDVQAGKYNYTVIGDEGSVQRANDRIKTQGVDNALNEFNVKFDTNLRFSKDDAVVAMILVNKLSAQGRVNEFKDLVSKMAILNTESGQFIQAGTLIKKLDPAGQLMALTKSIERINRKNAESKKGKKQQPLYIPQQYQDFFIEAQGKQVELQEQRKVFEQQQIELENTQREIDSLILSGVGEELGTLQNELNELRDLQKEQNALERKLVLLNEKLAMYSNENIEFLESDVQETKARVQEYQSRLNKINKNIKRFNELETILESISGVSQRDLNAIKNKYQNITQSNKAYAKLFGKLEGLTGVDVAKINEMKSSVKELEKAQKALQKLIDKNARFTSQENINEIMDETKFMIAQQLTATKMDKLNAWRYLSMLGNPRTHIRNVLGNTAMIPLVMGKNVIATTAQQLLPQEQRTKVLFASKEIKEFAKKDFEQHKDSILGDGKYTVEGEIAKNKKIFNNLILEWARTNNSNLLEKEDEVFAGFHYRVALSSYLTAQKVDINNISEDVLNKARDYAVQEARKATFRDASQLANKLSEIQRKGGLAGTALDAVIPFKKTPINIIKRGVEYSPIGLFKALAQEGYNLATGKTVNTTQFIDNISAGLTGTGIAVLGIMAYSMGMIELGGDDDETKKLSYLESAMGRQRYSLNILGGTYTIDWLSPSVMPFIVGAEMAKSYATNNESSVLNNGWDSLLNIMDPVFELTMLQGVTDTLSSFSGSGVAMVGESVKEMLANYTNQLIPTLLGQIARTIDPIQRSTLSDKQGIEKWVETTARKIANKIPGATFLNAPVINVKGEVSQSSENPFIRAFNNMANPGYYKETNVNSVDNEIMRLYDISNDSGVLPSIQPKSYTVNGESYSLSNEQYANAQEILGQTSYKLMREMIVDSDYKNLSDSDKMSILSSIYDYAYQESKEYSLKDNTEWQKTKLNNNDYKSYKKVKDAESNGIKATEYLIIKNYVATIREDDNSDNKGQFIDYLIRQGYLSKKNELLEMFGWKADSIEINGLESLTKLTDTIQIEGLKKLD